MAQATLRQAAQRPVMRPGLEIEAPAPAAVTEYPQRSAARPFDRWAPRYVCLVLVTAVACSLVGIGAAVTELEAVRYKLQEAVANERARALSYVQQINASLGPAARAAAIADGRLTRQPSAVVELRTHQPLPALQPSPVTSPQPLLVARAGSWSSAKSHPVRPDYAGVR